MVSSAKDKKMLPAEVIWKLRTVNMVKHGTLLHQNIPAVLLILIRSKSMPVTIPQQGPASR